jgi:signal transduction histidine kinase/CheY-like chemotaxis protein/HPt (histidine-containing phosphotransfer) domain-containing protein
MTSSWRKWFTLSFFLMALFFSLQANAQNSAFRPIIVGENTEDPIGPHIIVQRDEDGRITADKIRETQGSVLAGKLAIGNTISFGTDGAPHWLAFKILNHSADTDWILDLGRVNSGRTGNLKDFRAYEMPLPYPGAETRPAFYLNDITTPSFNGYNKIRIQRGTHKLIMVHVVPTSGIPTMITPRLHTNESMPGLFYRNAVVDLIYTAFFIAFTALSIFLAMRMRKLPIFVFSLYFIVIVAGFLIHQNDGMDTSLHGFRFLTSSLGFAHLALSLWSVKIFCNISETQKTERNILNTLLVLSALSALASVIPPLSGTPIQAWTGIGIPLAVYLSITLMSYAQTASGNVQGAFYYSSWVSVLIGFIITALALRQIIPANALTINLIWLSFIPQGIMLTIALFNGIKMGDGDMQVVRNVPTSDALNLKNLKQKRDEGNHSRLLRVIEKEREILHDLKQRDAARLEEMRVAKEEADEANRAKSAFLAVVSHEIRTPMTGVMGMVRLLLDSNITKQQKDHILTIQESGDAMLSLLNDILDFEKIQRGKMELENISLDLHRLIQGVVSLMSGHAAQKQVTLSARIDENLPRFVKGDPTRLRQVLLNLMGNALKFTEQGGVTLQVRNLSPNETSNNDNRFMIYFAVTDTGIGISEEAQKNLFSPFAQADSSISRKFGGTGLGLAISKGLVETMGSTININSKSGEGSTFFFTLNMERGLSTLQDSGKKTTNQATPAPTNINPLHVLVVDDNTINRKVISSFLAQDNHIITTSSSAEDALQKVETSDFDLILMDIELPGISGNEATNNLRKHENPRKANIPVIALTGNTSKEDMGRYLADGMNDMVPKPIDPDLLRQKMHEVVTHSNQREIISPDMARTTAAPPVAAPVIEPTAPVVVIEPQIKAAPASAENPFADSSIIVPDENMEISLSFDDETADGTEAAPAPVLSQDDIQIASPSITTADATPSIPIFNPEMLASLKNTIGEEQLQKLLDELLDKTDEILAGLDLAARAQNMDLLSARAHELKGMAGNFGLVEISDIAGVAERKARANETDGIGELVKTLPAANERARQAIKTWMSE